MCVVEDEKGKIDASCSMEPRDGMVIRTNTARLLKHRRMILELMLSSHCRDCTTCEKSGSCRLQELALRFGVRHVRFQDTRPHYELDESSPALVRDPNKCILCGDCIRVCEEMQGMGILNFAHRGSDLRVRVKVTLKDVAHGVEKKIKIPRYVPCAACHGTGAKNGSAFTTCSTCHGTGTVQQVKQTILGTMRTQSVCPTCGGEGRIIQDRCTACGGEGIVRQDDVVTVNIPAGVAEGMTLSMRGKGNAARHGGVPGDLLILIEEEKDAELLRDENDLVYNLMLDIPTAVFGGKVEVPTVDGKARLTIEPGTQPGKILRLRGKGLPSPNGYGNGDLLVNVMVYIPETLTASEREAFEKLKGQPNVSPNESAKKRIFSRLRHLFD